MKKHKNNIIIVILIVICIVSFIYPIFPWEDSYFEYLLGDMLYLSNSPYKEQFEEYQDISKLEAENNDFFAVYLLANGNDIYYITESQKGMGKELYNLNGEVVADLYDGSYNTLCGVRILNGKMYYVYGNIHSRQALGHFVKDAATVETDGKKRLFSIITVLKPNFGVYDFSDNTRNRINKRDYMEAASMD